MANYGYMTITGKAQGLISAGCSAQDSIGNINKPTHSPIIITKNLDKSSPLLAQTLSSKEEITCIISFYRVSEYQ